MIRVSTIFIGICMVLAATSIGVILHSLLGMGGLAAVIVTLTALVFLVIYQIITQRMRATSSAEGQIADLSRGTADLAHQAADFARRLKALEAKVAADSATTKDRVDDLTDEFNEMADLMQGLATTVAQHDDALAGVQPRLQATAETSASEAQIAPAAPVEVDAPSVSPDLAPNYVEPQRHDASLVDLVRDAVTNNRIDLYLQPVVTLPQRKGCFYETLSRLRTDTDQIIPAQDFIPTAETAGLMGAIDHSVLLRSMQVLRRLATRKKDLGIFCNISAVTLADPVAFKQCIEFLDANKALANFFILEFKLSTLRSLGPTESEHLAAIAQRGYRFSVDHVTDFAIDPRELAGLGVRFIKVSAELLLDQRSATGSDIHPADFANLLQRFGIDLIAERIETETTVLDLLDYDIRFGQGYLFSAPRPLRPEANDGTDAASPSTKAAHVAQAQNRPSTMEQPAQDSQRLTGNAALVRRIIGPH